MRIKDDCYNDDNSEFCLNEILDDNCMHLISNGSYFPAELPKQVGNENLFLNIFEITNTKGFNSKIL